MLRAACCAALMLGSLSSLAFSTSLANACEGADCKPAAVKPLDLMQFMHPNAGGRHSVHTASARIPAKIPAKTPAKTATKASHHHRRVAARVHHGNAPAHHHEHAIAAASGPPASTPPAANPAAQPDDTAATLTTDAAAAFASGPDQSVQVVSSNELNDIDRAAGSAPAETEGHATGPTASTTVAEASAPQAIETGTPQPTPQPAGQASQAEKSTVSRLSVSWMEALVSSWSSWVWASLTAVFGLLRELFG